mmetsp:Transcript_6736/g.8923  ORF Transcript_6736/g.8923 Transcript_6736/m.8923 type:complete len:219 (+) Transcript_6736:1977-2633(+)
MNGLIEVGRIDHRGHAIKDVVVGQNGSEKLLLSLDGMRQSINARGFSITCVDACNFVHDCPQMPHPTGSKQRSQTGQIVCFCGSACGSPVDNFARPDIVRTGQHASTSCVVAVDFDRNCARFSAERLMNPCALPATSVDLSGKSPLPQASLQRIHLALWLPQARPTKCRGSAAPRRDRPASSRFPGRCHNRKSQQCCHRSPLFHGSHPQRTVWSRRRW